jgi:hypothetical protein
MKSSKILNAAEMMTPRTVRDFVAWVRQEGEALRSTPEAKQHACSGSELSNKFYDEIYPLALFVEREFGLASDAIVTLNLNNDNFDATVTFEGLHSKVFIEITRAKNGYNESLRMEVLARDGYVFWADAGPITRVSGRKGTPERVIESMPTFVDHNDEQLAKHFSLVETTVKAKAGGRQYGKNFILLVIVDDYDHFRTDSDNAKLDLFVRNNLLCSDLDFARLIFIGIGGKLQLSYNLPRYNSATI